jgi:hypothetical protein
MEIDWEKVKREAKSALAVKAESAHGEMWLYAMVASIGDIGNGKLDWRKNLTELHAAANSIVDHWDVRMCAGLLDVFPHIIPKKYHGVTPTVYMDDVTERWVLDYGGMQA